MSTGLFARTLTPDECDRLIRRSRIRRAERAAVGGWIRYHLNWQMNNLSSGVGSALRTKETRYGLGDIEGAEIAAELPNAPHLGKAGVAPGLLNNFRPATTAQPDTVIPGAASCEGSQGGATSASPSGDSILGNATA